MECPAREVSLGAGTVYCTGSSRVDRSEESVSERVGEFREA